MTSSLTSAITSSIHRAIVLLFTIVRRECVECIAQGHVTGVTRYCAIVTSSSKGSLRQKLKVLRSSWKSAQACFRPRPTRCRCRFYVKMTSSHHATTPILLTCYVKNHDCSLDIARRRDGGSFSIRWRHLLHENSVSRLHWNLTPT